jgi:hypothetical protein
MNRVCVIKVLQGQPVAGQLRLAVKMANLNKLHGQKSDAKAGS